MSDNQRVETDPPDDTPVTIDEFHVVDIEAPIRDSSNVDCTSLGGLYATAASEQSDAGNMVKHRVLRLLASIAHMSFKPEDRAEPYAPQWVMGNRRSVIPADLKGEQSRVLATIAPGIQNPGLRARLADIAWYNDRSSQTMAQVAIGAYCEAIEAVVNGGAEIRYAPQGAVGRHGSDLLRRACQIAQATGWKDPEGSRLKSLMQTVLQQAPKPGHFRDFLNLGRLSMQFSSSGASTIATTAEILAASPAIDPHLSRELWQLAASAYDRSESTEDARRCRVSAAECYVTLAEAAGGIGIVASSHLMDAIRDLRNLPDTKERRSELEVKLRQAQAHIRDEMGVFSSEVNLTDLVDEARRAVGGMSLASAIWEFVNLSRSPTPGELRDAVEQQARDHPISSMMPRSIHDDDNKIVANSPGYMGNEDDDDAIRPLVAQLESTRRSLDAAGLIEPARRTIHAEHGLDLDDLQYLAEMSPFVPRDRTYLFGLGFTRFLNGDFASALHILVPQLENSLRHILRLAGQDPSAIQSDMTQEDRSLSVMLDKDRDALERVFGNAIMYEIENLFDVRCGPAIRHRLAHGLISVPECLSPDSVYASWFMFRLCCLPLGPYWRQIADRLDEGPQRFANKPGTDGGEIPVRS